MKHKKIGCMLIRSECKYLHVRVQFSASVNDLLLRGHPGSGPEV